MYLRGEEMNTELIADYQFERRRFENATGDVIIGAVILKDGGATAIKGPEPDGGFLEGRTYRFFGRWTEYRHKHNGRTEKQFSFSTVVESEPITEAGALVYLQRANGIGPAIARHLWATYGPAVFEVLKCGVLETVAARTGVALTTLEHARDFFMSESGRERSTIDLLGLLAGKGFPRTTVEQCIARWGVTAAARIRRNPFCLMAMPGVGFLRCDQLYLSMHLDPTRMKRQAYCALYGVDRESSRSGSTWVDERHAHACVRGLVSGVAANPVRAVKLARKARLLDATYADEFGEPDWDGTVCYLADWRRAQHEERLSKFVTTALQDTPVTTDWSSKNLSSHQRSKIQKLMGDSGCLRILGGGGGTGKTYSLARLVNHWIKIVGRGKIALAAPTGKAAVRITEALTAQGIKLRAQTWHKLLEYGANGFARDASNPLTYDIVVGDETSMLDTDMAYHAFAARPKGCLYFLVGDVHQLPPVSHGAPLRDMIAADVPYAELTEIQRNSGEIVRQGKNMRESGTIDLAENHELNLELMSVAKPSQQIEQMLEILAAEDRPCQVLTPTNKSGDLGRRNLNEILQNRLNPNPPIPGSPFRLGDKVVNLRNSWLTCLRNDDDAIVQKGQTYVANGEIGQVVDCEERKMQIKLLDPFRLVQIWRMKEPAHKGPNDDDAVVKPEEETGTGCKWDLAYALSVHKFQGSQVPVAIIMLDEGGGARRICSREWIYTAISRASEKCYLIGKRSVADQMVRVTKVSERKTFLQQLIQSGVLV